MSSLRIALRVGRRVFVASVLVLLAAITMAVAQEAFRDDSDLFYETVKSTVAIEIGDSNDADGRVGSGFYVSPHLLMTCAHVTENARRCHVYPDFGETTWVEGRVLYADTLRDVAIVYTDTASTFLSLRLDPPMTGEKVFAIGAPHGKMGSFSGGLVSHSHRDRERKRGLIQCTTETAHGSSGGPLLDRDRRVVGMSCFGEADASYIFGVDAETLREVLVRFSLLDSPRADGASGARGFGGVDSWPDLALDERQIAATLRPEQPFEEILLDEILPPLAEYGLIALLLLALAVVLVRRHRRLRRVALRLAVRAQLEELRSKAFLPDQFIEAESGA